MLSAYRPSWGTLRQSIQTVFAAVLAYLLAEWLGLPQGYWAVMTAILVVQANVGASLGLAVDRLISTVLGAGLGGALVYAFGVEPGVKLMLLAASVFILAYIASIRSSLRLAPVTAAIVVLADVHLGSPLTSAMNRVFEISLGTVVAIVTSLLVFPSRAGTALAGQVADVLPIIAEHIQGTIGVVLGAQRSDAEFVAINARVRAAFKTIDGVAGEARRELAGRIATHADPAAVVRTLRRLWYTAMIAARAAQPLIDPAATAVLAPLFHRLSDQVDRSLRTLAAAYTGGAELPDLSGLDTAVTSIDAAVATLRESGDMRALPTDTVASIFTLTFSLRQLGPNIHDLSDRLADLKDRTSQPAPALD